MLTSGGQVNALPPETKVGCLTCNPRPPPQNEDEMMLEVFKYTDRVVNMVRPRKILMIAVGE